MHNCILGELGQSDIVLFGLSLFSILALLLFYFIYTWMTLYERRDVSPYSGMPLRHATELTHVTRARILKYLKELHDYDNRPFDLERASFCRETGRIFPDTVKWNNAIKLDWTFITKRYRGHFVSWGSLSLEKKREVQDAHTTLDGFQTMISSEHPSPRLIEESIALAKPGPLYVDPVTHVLLGWKIVPGTEFEVLIVQKPSVVKLVNYQAAKI